MSEEPGVRHDVRHAVSWITLDRPEHGNALTPEVRERVIALLDEASSAPDIRAVVLTGAGRHFCTGADLTRPPQTAPTPGGTSNRLPGTTARIARRGVQRLTAAVLDCERPVVAAVNGTAAGVGMHLALACDFVIAAEGARFIEVFVRRGLVPDGGGAWLLPRLVGLQRAKELMMLGDDVPAERAERLGLVNHVVAADELEPAALALARRLAAGPPVALSAIKRLLNEAQHADRNAAFAAEAAAVEQARATADADEGIAAFLEKRSPVFGGW